MDFRPRRSRSLAFGVVVLSYGNGLTNLSRLETTTSGVNAN
ncbi:hypothetical protein RSSM_00278 [Rhodopirellula sallentina SM41]|uniref:Uncharacterized protein n=1 Tax=Rhodopirellula sallentina SM41 TaxID=1263870 RepID=M5UA20_9BACT|nr:hypothetical protein RSSM_00278 [Rhodopirellula sallentina SM41]